VSPTDIATVRGDPKLKLAIGDGLTYWGITINTNSGERAKTAIGQSALVRQAFELAIDRQALIDVVFGGLYTPVAQANSPSSPYYFTDIKPPPRDLDRARALLKQAGVTLPVQVELMAANSPDTQQVAEVIQSMVKDAGFDLKIKAMEFSSGLSAGYAGDFNTYLIGWSGRSDPDGNMWQMLHSGGAFNYGKYSTPTMDVLLDDARKVSGVAERRAYYVKVWQEERANLPLIYLWIQKNVVGMSSNVAGFVQVPDGLLRLTGVRLAP
jgi:peptide/nickel transport system substrate-binding protein